MAFVAYLLENAILVLFDMGPFNTFYYCCCYRTEKWICSKIAQRKIWCKRVQTREWICAKVVNATFAYLFQHGGVNRYRNLALITFAQIYSLVCTFLHQICAEQFCCKSIFPSGSSNNSKKCWMAPCQTSPKLHFPVNKQQMQFW